MENGTFCYAENSILQTSPGGGLYQVKLIFVMLLLLLLLLMLLVVVEIFFFKNARLWTWMGLTILQIYPKAVARTLAKKAEFSRTAT